MLILLYVLELHFEKDAYKMDTVIYSHVFVQIYSTSLSWNSIPLSISRIYSLNSLPYFSYNLHNFGILHVTKQPRDNSLYTLSHYHSLQFNSLRYHFIITCSLLQKVWIRNVINKCFLKSSSYNISSHFLYYHRCNSL